MLVSNRTQMLLALHQVSSHTPKAASLLYSELTAWLWFQSLEALFGV